MFVSGWNILFAVNSASDYTTQGVLNVGGANGGLAIDGSALD